jgi:hypothetical protein
MKMKYRVSRVPNINLTDFIEHCRTNHLFDDIPTDELRMICESQFRFIRNEIFERPTAGTVIVFHLGKFKPGRRQFDLLPKYLTDKEKDLHRLFLANLNKLKTDKDYELTVYRKWNCAGRSRSTNNRPSQTDLGEGQG